LRSSSGASLGRIPALPRGARSGDRRRTIGTASSLAALRLGFASLWPVVGMLRPRRLRSASSAPRSRAGLAGFAREGDEIVTRMTPGEPYQGPPGIMHGGLVMTLADEIGAWAIIALLEKFGVTAEMSGKLRRPVRIGRELEGRGRIAKPGGRVVGVAVKISQDGELAYEGELRLVLLDQRGAERLIGRPLPEAWRRFSR
jgi:acyl-coenzyme A thioesterase PaaI-like protein